MTDVIVKRLRSLTDFPGSATRQAADRIEELEAQLAEAKAALVRIDEASNHYAMTSTYSEGFLRKALKSTRDIARAALAKLEQNENGESDG